MEMEINDKETLLIATQKPVATNLRRIIVAQKLQTLIPVYHTLRQASTSNVFHLRF